MCVKNGGAHHMSCRLDGRGGGALLQLQAAAGYLALTENNNSFPDALARSYLFTRCCTAFWDLPTFLC